jgi:hypothetical protein
VDCLLTAPWTAYFIALTAPWTAYLAFDLSTIPSPSNLALFIRTYHFRFSTIQEETPYLRAVKQSKNREKIISALNELVKEGAIYNYKTGNLATCRAFESSRYFLRSTLQ